MKMIVKYIGFNCSMGELLQYKGQYESVILSSLGSEGYHLEGERYGLGIKLLTIDERKNYGNHSLEMIRLCPPFH